MARGSPSSPGIKGTGGRWKCPRSQKNFYREYIHLKKSIHSYAFEDAYSRLLTKKIAK